MPYSLPPSLGTVHFGGGGNKKTKEDFKGGRSQQNKGKKGVNMKYFRKTLK